MKKLLYSFLFVLLSVVTLPFVNQVYAQGDDDQSIICDWIPFLNDIPAVNQSICTPGTAGASGAVESTVAFIRIGLSFVFIGIIVIAVYVIVKAAVKYIRSEGNEEKIQEAQKAIKQVFVGIGALFVGLIGLVIIIAFFNATGAINDAEQGDIKTTNPVLNPLVPGQ